ncbi:peptidoglycan bridge formation glycyltransferase FemA/FemB family protein, partial [Staphylococcus devriesei]|uniref:peptidoglycan bridge formation glycyltransferase FemA/FemB family protein n=1 Tax=Staphylococcus devriesei TaxID=586733 RepID=UPI000E6A3672
MQFVTLSEIEFKNFVNQHFSHYTQSSQHFNYRNEFQQDVHLVGVKNNKNKVIAACLLTEAQALKFFKYFYTHRGPIMDFNNYELVKFFFKNLTKYLKKRKCLYILTDPYILENKRDTEG